MFGIYNVTMLVGNEIVIKKWFCVTALQKLMLKIGLEMNQ